MEAWMADIKSQFILNFIEKDRWRLLVDGLGNTLKITAVACLIGICIGVIIAIVRSTWDKNHLTMRPGIGKTLQNGVVRTRHVMQDGGAIEHHDGCRDGLA